MNTSWSANYISFQESHLVSRITLTMCLYYSVSAQVMLLNRGIMLTGMKECKQGGKGSHNLLNAKGIPKMTQMIQKQSFNNQMMLLT